MLSVAYKILASYLKNRLIGKMENKVEYQAGIEGKGGGRSSIYAQRNTAESHKDMLNFAKLRRSYRSV